MLPRTSCHVFEGDEVIPFEQIGQVGPEAVGAEDVVVPVVIDGFVVVRSNRTSPAVRSFPARPPRGPAPRLSHHTSRPLGDPTGWVKPSEVLQPRMRFSEFDEIAPNFPTALRWPGLSGRSGRRNACCLHCARRSP